MAEGRDDEGRAMARRAADQLTGSIGADPPDSREALELARGGAPPAATAAARPAYSNHGEMSAKTPDGAYEPGWPQLP